MTNLSVSTIVHLLTIALIFHSSAAVDFVFNGFDSSDLTHFDDARLQSRILTLTNDSTFSKGRSLYHSRILAKSPNSSAVLPFSTSFIFSISPLDSYRPGHGLAFLFAPFPGNNGTINSQHLSLFNLFNNGDPRNHILAVEFDLFENPEFKDIDANHVGIDINSLESVEARTAGFWVDSDIGSNSQSSFTEVSLNSGENYQAWIDYLDFRLNITIGLAGQRKPSLPLLSIERNLSDVFLDGMYVGFSAATGQLVESHRVLAWSFSNSNFSAYKALVTSNLPSFIPRSKSVFKKRGVIAGISIAGIVFISSAIAIPLLWVRKAQKEKRRSNDGEEMEEWELEYWPHRMAYREIHAATRGFSEANVIGIGGHGKVYKGVLAVGGIEIAVKCISQDGQGVGMKEFLAEISSLGRLKHRNLVGLRGWCKRETGGLILVYDFMENGSLEKRLFGCDEDHVMLGWEDRIRVLKDVAAGVEYLHEGWEVRVLHRDIKASNVMLDGAMNGRLGDFGLARMHGHGERVGTTRVVGTVGYMAPEVVQSGKASAKTDVFGYGVLVLEVVCGRPPVEEGKVPLVGWVRGLMEKGELVHAVDPRVWAQGGLDLEEVERVLKLGLWCICVDPKARPCMRQVRNALEMNGEESKGGGGEDMNAYLLQPSTLNGWKFRAHPTFDEVRQSKSSSVILSGSDLIVEGR